MKKMLGVAAVMMLGVSAVHASVDAVAVSKIPPASTTKDQKPVPHMLTAASDCSGTRVKLMPHCKN